MTNSPESMECEPCLEHPDYFPPKKPFRYFEDYIDKRLEDSIEEQSE